MIFWGVVFALWLAYLVVLVREWQDTTTALAIGAGVVLFAGLGVCMVGTVQALRSQTLSGKPVT
jgi:hypothetical protein